MIVRPPTCGLCRKGVAEIGWNCWDRQEVRIGRCKKCGLLQVLDFSYVNVSRYKADSYFPEKLSPIWKKEERWNLKRIKVLQQNLPDSPSRKVLDFGCGIGGFLKRAQGKFFRVIGYDLSKRMVSIHKKNGLECYNNLRKIPRDINTITLFHVLEHCVKPWKLIGDLLRQFKLVDRIIIETPNTEEALINWFNNSSYRKNHYSSDHVYYFTNSTLEKVAEKGGLKVIVSTQIQRYTLGNTFGWLEMHRGGGQRKWPIFNNQEFHSVYERALVKEGVADSVFLICAPLK